MTAAPMMSCQSPPLLTRPAEGNVSGDARHAAALRAAFPHGLRVRRGEETTQFGRSILVDAPFGPVLVAGGEVSQTLDGLPGAASHGTEGRVAAFYLRENGPVFRILRTFPNAARNGSFGELGEWSITRQFTARPRHLHRRWRNVAGNDLHDRDDQRASTRRPRRNCGHTDPLRKWRRRGSGRIARGERANIQRPARSLVRRCFLRLGAVHRPLCLSEWALSQNHGTFARTMLNTIRP